MGKIMILNGSPRAPKSNSKQYARLFQDSCPETAEYFEIRKNNHQALWEQAGAFSDLLFVFPLYADSLPVTLLNFLKAAPTALKNRPTVSVLINCGFLEPRQNEIAVEMMRLFAKQNGLPFGSSLSIGSGEAILDTPFKFFARRGIKQLAQSICSHNHRALSVTMPIPKKFYLSASTRYWLAYGARNGVSEEQMRDMKIEGQ